MVNGFAPLPIAIGIGRGGRGRGRYFDEVRGKRQEPRGKNQEPRTGTIDKDGNKSISSSLMNQV
jgi:hypothetical protein